MSGVFGVVNTVKGCATRALLDAMATSMTHRPWYQVETRCDELEGVGLGRIGIGIFNNESQPLASEDASVVLCLAGELYGCAAARRTLERKGYSFRTSTAAELALRLYQDQGATFCAAMEGMFVVAVWDRARHELVIANDRFGLYPLYYARRAGTLVFAPEMKGVLCDPDLRKQLDLTALAEYLRLQHLLGDKTFFEGVKLLPNACLLRYDLRADAMTLAPYWDFSQLPELPAALTFAEAVEEAARLLREAVAARTAGKHRLGVYLSGGADARALLGFVDAGRGRTTTITYGQPWCRDVVYAARIARRAGTMHHCFDLADGTWLARYADFHLELTEGFQSWVHAHGISILGAVRALIDVNLSGFGGGQTAVDWDDLALLEAPNDAAFCTRLFDLLSQKTTWPSVTEAEEALLFAPDLSARMRGLAFESLRAELAPYRHLPYDRRAAYFALCNPDRRLFQYFTVFHRSHFEQRLPFYDYRYSEFVYALPPSMLMGRRLRRAILARQAPHLAHVPYDKDDLPITASSVYRTAARLAQRGRSFVNRHVAPVFPEYATLYADYERWLRAGLKGWGEGILLGDRTLRRGIFSPQQLRSLWNRQQSGLEVNMIGKLAPVMTWEMMLRRFWD
jgi:asparagine synthase (glutamine-hydrolysing)